MSEGKSWFKLFSCAAIAVALLMFMPQSGLAAGRTGDVYVLTNQPTGNSVMTYHRDAQGMLSFVATVASGGVGTGTGGDPLGSQNPLILSCDHRLLFVVNAGSDSISVFGVKGDGLMLLQTVASGGTMPVSLAVQGDLLYALNAGGTPNISGFWINPRNNNLMPLMGSTQVLPGGAASAGAQISFSPDGGVLVVTEKGTNMIDTFVLNQNGVAQPGMSTTSNGATPFGFDFGHNNVAIVSDAAGGPDGTSALTSYKVDDDGMLNVITPALGDTQFAACWVVVPESGKYAYTSNSASNTISSYSVSGGGDLMLMNATAASANAPVDMALSANSQFLYTRNAGDSTISGFRIGGNGSLTMVTSASGLPAGAAGIAAR